MSTNRQPQESIDERRELVRDHRAQERRENLRVVVLFVVGYVIGRVIVDGVVALAAAMPGWIAP